MKTFTAIDLESAQGYCIRICQFELELVENGMITQEVDLLAPSGIARLAKERGIITVGIVLIPLFTEAMESFLDIDKLHKQFDSLLVIDFNKQQESKNSPELNSDLLQMNEAVATVIKGITAIVLQPQFDRNDIKAVLCDSNRIFSGFSVASGKNRAKKAIVTALLSPYLGKNNMGSVKNVLLLLTSGIIALTIDEIGEVSDYLQAAADYNASITIAVSEDMKLGKSLSIAIFLYVSIVLVHTNKKYVK
jgi:cell division protein FtsZ